MENRTVIFNPLESGIADVPVFIITNHFRLQTDVENIENVGNSIILDSILPIGNQIPRTVKIVCNKKCNDLQLLYIAGSENQK